jgi:hypothetical protein
MNPTPVVFRGRQARIACLAALSQFAPFAFAGVIVSSNFSNDVIPAANTAAANPTDWSISAVTNASSSATATLTYAGTIDARTNTRVTEADAAWLSGIAVPAGNRTSAITLSANLAGSPWNARVQTGLLKMAANSETNLAKLTLSFDLTSSQVRPIVIRLKTWNDNSPGATGSPGDKFTGELKFTLMPVIAGSSYRYSIDLDTMTPVTLANRPTGYATFDPTSNGSGTDGKRLQLFFQISGSSTDTVNWPAGSATVSIDNISLTSPRYYVSPNGSGTKSGLSSANAAKLDGTFIAGLQPGDVVLLKGGAEYLNGLSIKSINGTPARWISFRAEDYLNPPVVRKPDWSVVYVNASSSYINIEGLHVKGYYDREGGPDATASNLTLADAISDGETLNTYPGQEKNPAYNVYTDSPPGSGPSNLYIGAGKYNANGIYLNGRENLSGNDTNTGTGIHHIRVARNTVYNHTGAGIALDKSDYIYVEGIIVSNNNKLSRYGGSGLSSLQPVDFDGRSNTKIFFIGNTSANNGANVRWGPRYSPDPATRTVTIRYSDGNGIILDTHRRFYYGGRTLVQNNVVYENGGSGIHTVATDRVDIVNNTSYHNGKPNTAPPSVTDVVLKVSAAGLKNTVPYGVYNDITLASVYSPSTPDKQDYKVGGDFLNYGEISAHTMSGDIRIINNLMWAYPDRKINDRKPNWQAGAVSYVNNLFGRDGGNPTATTAATSTRAAFQGVYTTGPAATDSGSTAEAKVAGFHEYTGNVVVTDTTPANVFSNYTTASTDPYGTYLHLKAGSPAGNAGVGANVTNRPGVPLEDRINRARPKNGTGGVDIGAFEDL